ncbi:hypothetical protein ACH4GM_27470 [Streptomyces coeruleorubidus]|uniref:hypothetical protein n=1 Tax=Streptomyces coeruleorubidus TaxID=116188 RepID=UPI0037982D43
MPADAISPPAQAAALAEPESDPPALRRPVFTDCAGSAPPPPPREGTQKLFFVSPARARGRSAAHARTVPWAHACAPWPRRFHATRELLPLPVAAATILEQRFSLH